MLNKVKFVRHPKIQRANVLCGVIHGRPCLRRKKGNDVTHVLCKFGRYGLYFPDTNTNAVMYTDSTGAATVRIAMPAHMQSSLIFHYNLKFYDNDGDGYDGVSLKRFVMQVRFEILGIREVKFFFFCGFTG